MDENINTVREASRLTAMKSYIERMQHHLKRCIPKNGRTQRSPKFTFDPGDFIYNLPRIIPSVSGHDFDGSVGIRLAGGFEFDHGEARRGGGFDG